MSFRRDAAVDKNQPEIVKALRKLGAKVVITSQLKNAFDILVGFRGRLFIMELKDGDLPPSRKRLTDGEIKCKEDFEAVGIEYHVIESKEQAINLVLEPKATI